MSETGGAQAGSAIGRASAEFRQIIANLALPAIQQSADAMLADLGQVGEEPASVRRAFGEARQMLGRDYSSELTRGRATIDQAARQSGLNYNPAAISDATGLFERQLAEIQARRQRSLQFAEANAGQNQTNYLLSALTGQAGQLFGGALGFGQNALTGAGILNQLEQQGGQRGATYGSIAGTIIGGLIGNAPGAAIGGAAGGAVGGYFGAG